MLGTRSRARGAYTTPLEDEDAGEREDQNQHGIGARGSDSPAEESSQGVERPGGNGQCDFPADQWNANG